MKQETRKAILVVSFGTSYEPTRKVTIDAIEKEIADAFPSCRVYRAWTSRIIIAKLRRRDGLSIHTVKEAMEQMLKDGITDVIVQPTHVINGIENDRMKEDALSYAEHFSSISFGTPLLTSEQDNVAVIHAVAEEFKYLEKDTALVLMGHGTTHYSNTIYAALDYQFKDLGYPHIFLGTVEAYPAMHSLLRMLPGISAQEGSACSIYDRGRGSCTQRYGWRRSGVLDAPVPKSRLSGCSGIKGPGRIFGNSFSSHLSCSKCHDWCIRGIRKKRDVRNPSSFYIMIQNAAADNNHPGNRNHSFCRLLETGSSSLWFRNKR